MGERFSHELLTYDEFSDFVLNRIKRVMDNVKDIVPTEKMVYKIELEGELSVALNLQNVWNNYIKTGELEGSIINLMQSLFQYTQTVKNPDNLYDMDELIPTIRDEGYSKRSLTSFAEQIKETGKDIPSIMHDKLAEGIEMVYAFDTPSSVMFAVDKQLPEGISVEEAKSIAKQNLIKRGWVNHIDHDQFGGGTLYFYSNHVIPFNAQFLIPELYKDRLGDNFYFGVPNRDLVLVLKPSNFLLSTPSILKPTLKAFQQTVLQQNRNEISPVSRAIYHMKDGVVTICK